LLREAFYGAHRFDEFVRRAGFTEPVTAARLRELVDDGLLERRPYQDPGQRTRFEYHLTEKAATSFPRSSRPRAGATGGSGPTAGTSLSRTPDAERHGSRRSGLTATRIRNRHGTRRRLRADNRHGRRR
jgi:hypothetical protein